MMGTGADGGAEAPATRHSPPSGRRWLALVTLAAFALRVWRLDGQGLWSDESISLERALLPLGAMLAELPVEHAPLYFVLLNLWLRVAGATDFALRFPSLWCGVAAVPLVAALARRTVGRRTALTAALLLAVNPLHVWHAQDARMYTLATCLALAALAALARALRTGAARDWAGYGLAGAATLYTHYYGGLVVAIGAVGGALAIVRDGERRGPARAPEADAGTAQPAGPAAGPWPGDGAARPGEPWSRPGRGGGPRLRDLAAAHAAIGLLFLPWLPRAIGVLGFAGWRDPLDPATLPGLLATRFFLGPTMPADLARWPVLGAVALLGLGLAATAADLRRGRAPRGAAPGGGWLVVGGVALLVAAIGGIVAWKADLHERYFLPATPLLYIAVARGLGALGGGWVRFARPLGLALLVAASGVSLWHHYTDLAFSKPDYREFTRHMVEVGNREDALFLLGPGRFLTARYGGDGLPKIYNLESTKNRAKSPAEVEALLDEVARERRRVWLAVEGRDPGTVMGWLDAHGYRVEGGWRVGVQLFYYSFPRAASPLRPAAGFAGGAGENDVAFAVSPPRPAAGAIAHVDLTWRTRRPAPLADPQVSLRLVDPHGATIAAWDGALSAAGGGEAGGGGDGGGSGGQGGDAAVLSARAGLRVPADAAAARHRLVAILYAREGLAPLGEADLGDVAIAPAEDERARVQRKP